MQNHKIDFLNGDDGDKDTKIRFLPPMPNGSNIIKRYWMLPHNTHGSVIGPDEDGRMKGTKIYNSDLTVKGVLLYRPGSAIDKIIMAAIKNVK